MAGIGRETANAHTNPRVLVVEIDHRVGRGRPENSRTNARSASAMFALPTLPPSAIPLGLTTNAFMTSANCAFVFSVRPILNARLLREPSVTSDFGGEAALI